MRNVLLVLALAIVLGACPPKPTQRTTPRGAGSRGYALGKDGGGGAATGGAAVNNSGGAARVQPSLPPLLGAVVAQHTPMHDLGAVFVGAARGSAWLLRWSKDEVYLHEAKSGALLWRVPADGREIVAAAVAPSGGRMCLLTRARGAASGPATLQAVQLPTAMQARRTLWSKAGVQPALHPALLATASVCAVLQKSSGGAKPYVYRAFSWASGARAFDSAPVAWYHRDVSALQQSPDGRALLAVFSTKGSSGARARYNVEWLDVSSLATSLEISVDCAMLDSGGSLHLSGGGLDARHWGWIKKKVGRAVVGGSTQCVATAPGGGASERARASGFDRVLVARGPALELRDGRGARIATVARRIGDARLGDDALAQHLVGKTLLLDDGVALYRWNLGENAARRVGALPAAASGVRRTWPRFGASSTQIALRVERSRKRHELLLLDANKGGAVSWRSTLAVGDRHRPRPAAEGAANARWIFRRTRFSPRPSDVRWVKNAEGLSLAAFDTLSGVFTFAPDKTRRPQKRCCRRATGTGGVFGLSVAPGGDKVAFVISGRQGGVELRRLPTLESVRAALPLAHRRNDYARTVWLDGDKLALLRDARFIDAPASVTIYDVRSGKVLREVRFGDRGALFWSASAQLFYQLHADDHAVTIVGADGRVRTTVGLSGGAPWVVRGSGHYSCSGAGCAALRCRRDGRSQPISACGQSISSGALPAN